MKKRLTAFLLLAALVLTLPAAAAFRDIPDETTALAAATLQGLGVVDGTGDGVFDPNGTLTRAQGCKMIVELMGLGSKVSTYSRKTLFTDVPSSAWYNGYVNLAYHQGVINGYGNGTFGPNDPITYGQLATILLRMLGYQTADIGTLWPLDYTAFCEDLGLTEGLTLSPMAPVTRGQAAVLMARAAGEKVNGSGRAYYETMAGVSSKEEVILLSVSAAYGGSTGLVMAYSLEGSGGTVYYGQTNRQSEALQGSVGTLLFDGAGKVCGFIPQSGGHRDVVIGSATASALTTSGGESIRIPADAVVVSGGEVYSYRISGYLQLSGKAGRAVRLFEDENGRITHLYLSGGASSRAVVAKSASLSALERELDLTGLHYTITKNGGAAGESALQVNDVAWYDSASGTLRLCDHRVSGYLSAASPSISAASTITVAGHSFEVMESAWESLGSFSLGDQLTLFLTDDGKVASVGKTTSKTEAEMIGVLDAGGRSVTLVGSGITLSGTIKASSSDLGGLVKVTASSATELSCKAVSKTSGGKLDVQARTLGGVALADTCAIYEWAGSGYVYDLEGSRGAASGELSVLSWADTLPASAVSYYHLNSVGEVDILLLHDVTGNLYRYGKADVYPGAIKMGEDMTGNGVTITNGEGVTEKYYATLSVSDGSYLGLALGTSSQGYTRTVKAQSLRKMTGAEKADFYLSGGKWHVETDGVSWTVADNVQIHISAVDTWMSGEEGLLNILADGYRLTLYADRSENEGGQIRLIRAE